MTTTNKPESNPKRGPLALHIRRQRQWYGHAGMSQKELAELVGITPRQLYHYETTTEMPDVLGALLMIALALKIPLEDLIAPTWIESQRELLDERRCEHDLRRDAPECSPALPHEA